MDAIGIIRQIEGDAALRAQMRAVLLGDEMLELPHLVRRLTEVQERTSQQISGLAARVDQLADQVTQLAQVQAATEARLVELARAQAATEARIGELAASTERRFAGVEARLDELTRAQAATEARIGELAASTERRFAGVEARLDELTRAQAATEARIGELAASTERRFAAVEARLGRVEQDLGKVMDDLGDVKGSQFELKVRDNPRRFVPRRLASAVRLVEEEQLTAYLEVLDSTTAEDVERADALIEAHLPGGGLAVLVVEASWTAHVDDIERARRRTEALGVGGVDARALVVSHVTPAEQVVAAARRAGVMLVAETDGPVVFPGVDAA